MSPRRPLVALPGHHFVPLRLAGDREGKAEDVIDIGSRRELFVDRFLIDRMDGVALALEKPRDEGIAVKFDRPWEGAFCGYATVLKDGEHFRVYYRGLPGAGKDGSDAEVTCVAESRDGMDWVKPELGPLRARGEQGEQHRPGRHGAVLAQLLPDDRPAPGRAGGRALQGPGRDVRDGAARVRLGRRAAVAEARR